MLGRRLSLQSLEFSFEIQIPLCVHLEKAAKVSFLTVMCPHPGAGSSGSALGMAAALQDLGRGFGSTGVCDVVGAIWVGVTVVPQAG